MKQAEQIFWQIDKLTTEEKYHLIHMMVTDEELTEMIDQVIQNG